MLDYEWGISSTIILAGNGEPTQDSGQTPPNIFDHYSDQTFGQNLINPNQNGFNNHPNHHHFHHPQTQNTHFQSLYDPRTYARTGYMADPKTEPAGIDYTSRIVLNLGGRTYFSASENDFVNRRFKALEPGLVNSSRCQAKGCNADLTHAKHYHRRHKVCEFHSKAASVIAGGLTQRFCQQCSRFDHSIFSPNSTKAKGVAAKGWRITTVEGEKISKQIKLMLENAHNSSSENLTRSPPDLGGHSSSSVTIDISPTEITSLGSSRQRSHEAPSSSVHTSSLFFSNG